MMGHSPADVQDAANGQCTPKIMLVTAYMYDSTISISGTGTHTALLTFGAEEPQSYSDYLLPQVPMEFSE